MPLADDGSMTGWPWLLLLISTGALALLLHVAVAAWAAKAPSPGARADAEITISLLRQLKSDAEERKAVEAARREEEAAQRKAEAARRDEEACLRFIQVQRWDGPVSAMVQLRLSYGAFLVQVLAAVRVTGAPRLYLLYDDNNWLDRQPLTADTFCTLLELSRDLSSPLPNVYVFEQVPGTRTSPGAPPLALGAEAPQVFAVEDGCSSRSSAAQASFRRALLLRDGEDSGCALCSERPVEAAHIIPRIASADRLMLARLPEANYVWNGILLCQDCHFLHDQHMWHFMPSTGVIVADALANDSELGALWSGRVGRQLARPAGELQASWWPSESVWIAAHADFEAAREGRRALADEKPYACAECNWRGKTARGLKEHRCDRVKTRLFTPLPFRAAGGGGGGNEE
jgi:hypothetical protein